MSKRMLVNAAQEGEVRVATIEENVLEELNVAIEGNELLKGNLYKAVVVSVESGLQAAFVDYGAERNGFITFNDIHRRYYNKKVKSDGKRLRIQDAIAPGAELLVQVYKEEVGNKGAALTTDITQPGRYLVLMPFSDGGGVSRKIESESTRTKLKEIINKLNVPDDMGLIVRTAGQGRNKTELQKDYQALVRSWGHSLARYEQLKGPGLVYREPDVVIRSVRDYFTDDVSEILVDSSAVMDRLVEYFEVQAPDILPRVKRYKGQMPLFSNFGLERQLENISSPKVGLPSGGSIVINPTEALTAIDVNSGKSRGQSNQEEMALQTNLEAAVEAARQLRLRDLGGLVVIDFIDMYENKNRRSVEKVLKAAMKRDKARVEIGRISRFGLLELSRQRIKARLISSTHNPCPMCEGSGYVMSTEVAAVTMLRRLQELAVSAPKEGRIRGRLPVAVALRLLNEHRSSIADMEQSFDVSIEIVPEIGALSTRDAFEIITKENAERGKEERSTGRDRKDRGRNKRRNTRSDSSRTDRGQSNSSKSIDSEQPYEAPKVVGFIEPKELAEADQEPKKLQSSDAGENNDSSENARDSEQPEGKRRRRRRRRRRDEGDSNNAGGPNVEQESATKANDSTVDEAEAKRNEARERNMARRNARLNARKSEGAEQPQPETKKERVTKTPSRSRPKPVAKESPKADIEVKDSNVARQSDVAQASRKAAEKLRSRLSKGAESSASKNASKPRVEPPKAKAEERPKTSTSSQTNQSKRSKTTSVAELVKAKLKGRSSQSAGKDTAETKRTPKTPAKKAQSKATKASDTPAARRAAEIVRARLASKKTEQTTEVVENESPEKPKAAKPRRARASRATSSTSTTQPKRSTRATKPVASVNEAELPSETAQAEAEGAKPKPKRAPRKAATSKAAASKTASATKRTAARKTTKTAAASAGTAKEKVSETKSKTTRPSRTRTASKTTATKSAKTASAKTASAKTASAKTAPADEKAPTSDSKASRPRASRSKTVKSEVEATPNKARAKAKPAETATKSDATAKAKATTQASSEEAVKPKTARTSRAKAPAKTAAKPKATRATKAVAKPKQTRAKAKPAAAKTAADESSPVSEEKPKRTRTSRAKKTGDKTAAKKPAASKAKTTSARAAAKKAGDRIRQKQGAKAATAVETEHLEREKAASVLAKLK